IFMLINDNDILMRSFARESFGALSVLFNDGLSSTVNHILAELFSLINDDVQDPRAAISDGSWLHKRAVELYKCSLKLNDENIFIHNNLQTLLKRNDIDSRLYSLIADYVGNNSNELRARFDVLRSISEQLSFFAAAFIHFFHHRKDVERAKA